MAERPEFVFGVNPVVRWTGEDYETAIDALAAFLATKLSRPVRLGEEPTYQAQVAAMRDGTLDAAIFGTYAFYRAREEAGALALVVRVEQGSNTPGSYQSVILAGAGSAAHSLRDARGLRVGFVDEHSTSGYLIPRRMLREAGLDPDTEIRPRFCRTHQAVLDAILAGDVDVGAVYRDIFTGLVTRDATSASRLRVIATSPPLPAGPVAVRRELGWDVRQRLLLALLCIHEDAAASRLVLPPGSRFRPASSRSVTLKTVAALAGTSYGTVSRVINKAARVAPETYVRVMSVVEDLGYRPNAAALSLIANRSELIGVVAPDETDPILALYLAGAKRALGSRGMQVVLCPTNGDRADEARYLQLLETGRFGGLLLTAWSLDTPQLSTLVASGHAIVMLGVPAESAPVPSVAPDIHAAMAVASEHLRGLGHERIGTLLPPSLLNGVVPPSGGTALLDNTFGPDNAYGLAIYDGVEEAYRVACALLEVSSPPSALVCGSERIALGAIRAAHDQGIAVPGALSVIALGESWLAQASTPPLTTINLPFDVLGERVALSLLAHMSNRPLPALPTVPAPLLIQRASTGAARASR